MLINIAVPFMKNIFQFKIEPSLLTLKPPAIYKALGYGASLPPNYIIEFVETMLNEVSTWLSIEGGYKIFEDGIKINEKNSISINSINFNTEKIITSQLKKAKGIAIFVCSLGE